MKAKECRLETKTVAGQPSWRLANNTVEAFITHKGGHLGPITFNRQGNNIQPYSVAPWAEEKIASTLPPILEVLRGDFFCMPFGGNANPFKTEKHPIHGETANAPWQFECVESEGDSTTLRLSLETKVRKGRVDKEVTLVENQNIVYCKHTLSGMSGPMSPGHHAMLHFPEAPGSGFIATSPFVFGQVFPGQFEDSSTFGYSCLKAGATFDSLKSVPMANGGNADLTSYPARRGFEDLVMMVNDETLPFTWTAVTFAKERFVWFALKNPRILRNTVFWISNAGRHYPPWNSRHSCVMGLEDVTSYFHCGLAESAKKNSLNAKGYPTCLKLSATKPTVIPYIMGIANIPANFGNVVDIKSSKGGMEFKSSKGKRLEVAVDLAYLG